MSCPTIADKIARAQMRDDRHFFQRLRNALRGPTQTDWAAYCDSCGTRFLFFASLGSGACLTPGCSGSCSHVEGLPGHAVGANKPARAVPAVQAHRNHLKCAFEMIAREAGRVFNPYPFQEANAACLARKRIESCLQSQTMPTPHGGRGRRDLAQEDLQHAFA